MVRHRRPGVSEVLAAVITIAITLVAGYALFGYVNGQAAVSEDQLGVANAHNVNFLNEQFVVAQVAYASSGSSISVYIYDSGQATFQPASIEVYNTQSRSSMDLLYDGTRVADLNNPGCHEPTSGLATFSVNPLSTSMITLSLPGCFQGSFLSPASQFFTVTVVGIYGNVVSYFQEA
ncbi:MAG: hypothetical protein OK438_00490 [Thaumarchaeota archaeon]|nr:hypothetical protein [Nitrososphaerota archaeon]